MNYTEKTEVRELFDMYDLDDSGSICRNELKLIMQSLGFTITDGNVLTVENLDLTKISEICEAWMQEYDEDGNEVIDFLEFYRVRILSNHKVTLKYNRFKVLFRCTKHFKMKRFNFQN